jgi:hypothetical protein
MADLDVRPGRWLRRLWRCSWPRLAAGVGVTLWVAALWAAAPVEPSLGERVGRLQEEARRAREGKDFATYRARLLVLYELLNGHP